MLAARLKGFDLIPRFTADNATVRHQEYHNVDFTIWLAGVHS